ncbi:predicted protein [Nematostella vectensis]|uniref:Uncharacterized protein n=1 Tax=Nematostella vectensis TaxID=45351 RepID=A7S4R3_NEMVE|nr:centromere protein F [Nematostella vectensis]EDO41328.1 predicted protein [Nematostella vectensis]|eukprot:XP_001633391.1 predicted protein [Nematostella vectensis]
MSRESSVDPIISRVQGSRIPVRNQRVLIKDSSLSPKMAWTAADPVGMKNNNKKPSLIPRPPSGQKNPGTRKRPVRGTLLNLLHVEGKQEGSKKGLRPSPPTMAALNNCSEKKRQTVPEIRPSRPKNTVQGCFAPSTTKDTSFQSRIQRRANSKSGTEMCQKRDLLSTFSSAIPIPQRYAALVTPRLVKKAPSSLKDTPAVAPSYTKSVSHHVKNSKENSKEKQEVTNDKRPVVSPQQIIARSKPMRTVMELGAPKVQTPKPVDLSPIYGKLSSKLKKVTPTAGKGLLDVLPSRHLAPRPPVTQLQPFTQLSRSHKCIGFTPASHRIKLEVPAVRAVMRVLEGIYKDLQQVRSEGSNASIQEDLTKKPCASNPVTYVQELGTAMVDIVAKTHKDLKDTCIAKEKLQHDAESMIIDYEDQLSKKRSETKALVQTMQGLQDELEETKSDFKSLETLTLSLNNANEKLETQTFAQEKELERNRLGLVCKARELENLRCEIKRRDLRSSELLNEYMAVSKEKNSLLMGLGQLRNELEESDAKRTQLQLENQKLEEAVDELKRELEAYANSTEKRDNICGNQDLSEGIHPTARVACPPTETEEKSAKEALSDIQEESEMAEAALPYPTLKMAQPETLIDALFRINTLELQIMERNSQVKNFAEIVDALKNKCCDLERERFENLTKLQAMRLESIQEAKQMQVMEEKLQDKEAMIEEQKKTMDELSQKYTSVLREHIATSDQFAEKEKQINTMFRRAVDQTRDMSVLIRQQSETVAELTQMRDRLLKENTRLRSMLHGKYVKDGNLEEVPKGNAAACRDNEDPISRATLRNPPRKVHFFNNDDVAMRDIKLGENDAMVLVVHGDGPLVCGAAEDAGIPRKPSVPDLVPCLVSSDDGDDDAMNLRHEIIRRRVSGQIVRFKRKPLEKKAKKWSLARQAFVKRRPLAPIKEYPLEASLNDIEESKSAIHKDATQSSLLPELDYQEREAVDGGSAEEEVVFAVGVNGTDTGNGEDAVAEEIYVADNGGVAEEIDADEVDVCAEDAVSSEEVDANELDAVVIDVGADDGVVVEDVDADEVDVGVDDVVVAEEVDVDEVDVGADDGVVVEEVDADEVGVGAGDGVGGSVGEGATAMQVEADEKLGVPREQFKTQFSEMNLHALRVLADSPASKYRES